MFKEEVTSAGVVEAASAGVNTYLLRVGRKFYNKQLLLLLAVKYSLIITFLLNISKVIFIPIFVVFIMIDKTFLSLHTK